jgi:hypothetical protein
MWGCFPNGVTCNLGVLRSENMVSGRKFYCSGVVTAAFVAIAAALFA